MSRGKKLKTNSSVLSSTGCSSPPASAGSGVVNVAKETRSPKFDFMNSAIFVFNSSGDGKGGGGFCSILATKMIARDSNIAQISVNLTLQGAICSPAIRRAFSPQQREVRYL